MSDDMTDEMGSGESSRESLEQIERDTSIGVRRLAPILNGGDLSSLGRGWSNLDIRPVSKAVVVGIGGTGVQVAGRLKAAIQADRTDQRAVESVSVISIDSVGEREQKPSLPLGVHLGSSLHRIATFDASRYIRGQLPNDPFLQSWWDNDYEVIPGSLINGLKRERMLGRLAFYKDRPSIRKHLVTAMRSAAAVRSEHISGGDPG
ncbi:MAG: tubulin-like doman-containing protein, partial [Microthrixaceae bacterium]